MYNIDLFKIYLFTYLCCVVYRVFLQNLTSGYPIPRFATSFKPINGWDWETSTVTPEILIKLYGIKLIAQLENTTWTDAFTHLTFLETALLITTGNSSFVLHGTVSMCGFAAFKAIKSLKI